LKSDNFSSLAMADCSTKMRFLCHVREKGTLGKAMQQECLETWDVTSSEGIEVFRFPYTNSKSFFRGT